METIFAFLCYLGFPIAFAVWSTIELIKEIKSPPDSAPSKNIAEEYRKCKQQETQRFLESRREIQRLLKERNNNEDIVKQRGATNSQPNKAGKKKTH